METKNKIKLAVIFFLIFNPFTLIVFFLAATMWTNKHPDVGEHIEQVDWLPPGASDICYYKTYSYTAYEFNISESEFREWGDRWEFTEIQEPFEIWRYNLSLVESPDRSGGYDTEAWEEYNNLVNATIVDGLCYRTPPRGNGGGVYVAYDRVTGRAYFQSSPR